MAVIRVKSVWFFAVAYAWSWFFWLMAAALGANTSEPLGQALKLAGLLGPAVAGVTFTLAARDASEWREYWLRAIDVRRISPVWYLVIFMLAPSVLGIAAMLDTVFGGSSTPALIQQRALALTASPQTIIPFLLGVLINGPLPEELGWRGYALNQLQGRWSALTASLVLGAFWAVWHVPLFFMSGMQHAAHGPWSPWFWLFLLSVFPTCIIFTWIFNNTKESTLGAILFHFTANLAYTMLNVTDRTNLLACLLWILAAVIITVKYGPLTLSGKTEPSTGK